MSATEMISITGPTVERINQDDRFCVVGLAQRPGRAVLMDRLTGDCSEMNIRQARRWARMMNQSEKVAHENL